MRKGFDRIAPAARAGRVLASSSMKRELTVPWFLDAPRPGLDASASGPTRRCGAVPGAGDKMSAVAPIHREIAAFTEDTVGAGDVPVIVAGDCCASIAVVAGLQRALPRRGIVEPVLVWLDAHGDFNTPATSASGFLGGMPLAMLTGRGNLAMLDALGATPLPDERVRLGDARDLDPPERETLDASAIRRAACLGDLLGTLAEGAPVHLHFDCDVITSADVPAQSYPVPGGPGAAEVESFLAGLAARTSILAISVCAWDPALDADGESARLCRRCLAAALDPTS